MFQSNTVANANRTIKPANSLQTVINYDGATFDIIKAIVNTDKTAYKDTINFSQYLKGSSLKETCKNIWDFVHTNIIYKEDPNGYQYIKTPASLWNTKTGDCKSFSIFVASILKNLNINYLYRFVSFDNGNYTHVYIVVPTGKQEIIIDTTIKYFNTETQFKTKKDIPMTKIIKVSGVGTDNNDLIKIPISNFRVLQVKDSLNIANNILLKQFSKSKTLKSVLLTKEQFIKIYINGNKNTANIGLDPSTTIAIFFYLYDHNKKFHDFIDKAVTSIINTAINTIINLFSVNLPANGINQICLTLNDYQVSLISNSNINDNDYNQFCYAINLVVNSIVSFTQLSINDSENKKNARLLITKNIGDTSTPSSYNIWINATDSNYDDIVAWLMNTLLPNNSSKTSVWNSDFKTVAEYQSGIRDFMIDLALLPASISYTTLFSQCSWFAVQLNWRFNNPTLMLPYIDANYISANLDPLLNKILTKNGVIRNVDGTYTTTTTTTTGGGTSSSTTIDNTLATLIKTKTGITIPTGTTITQCIIMLTALGITVPSTVTTVGTLYSFLNGITVSNGTFTLNDGSSYSTYNGGSKIIPIATKTDYTTFYLVGGVVVAGLLLSAKKSKR